MSIERSQPSLQHVVNGIYDAALEPGLWPEVIRDVASYGRSTLALLSWRNRPRTKGPLALRVETPHLTRLVDEYFAGGYNALILSDPITQIVNSPLDEPVANEKWESREEFLTSERYRRFHRPGNIDDRACVLVMRDEEEVSATLTLCRTRRDGRFNKASLRPLRELSPHVRRALQITHRFRSETAHRNSLVGVLEKIDDGVFFLDGARRVIFANAAAERLVKKGVLAIRHGRLRAVAAQESTALEALLQRVVKTGDGTETDPGGTLSLHGQDGRFSASIAASPLRTFHGSGTYGPRQVRAAVFIRNAAASATSGPDLLRNRFGLTPAEARVASGLQEGYRLQEIADRHGLGKETVRSQLSAIFDKTGVRRQSDLVKMLLTTPGRAESGIAV